MSKFYTWNAKYPVSEEFISGGLLHAHTHTHTQTHYMQLMSVYWSLHQKINNEVTYIDDIPECCMYIYIHVPCWAVVIDSPSLYIVLEHSRSPSTQDDYSSYRWFKSAAYRHCVIGLLTSIVWTLIDRLDDVYITDIVYLLDVLVVIVYMS